MKLFKILYLVGLVFLLTGCYETKVYNLSKIYDVKKQYSNVILKLNVMSKISENPSLIVSKNKDIIFIDSDNIINILETKNSNKTRKILGYDDPKNDEKVKTIALSSDEKILAVAGIQRDFGLRKGSVRLFDYSTGKLIKNIDLTEHEITDIEFTDDMSYLVVGNAHGQIISYNLRSNKIVKTVQTHTKYKIKDLKIRSDEKNIYKVYASSTPGDTYMYRNRLQNNGDEFFIQWSLNSDSVSHSKFNSNLHTDVDKINKYRAGSVVYISHGFINSYLVVHETKYENGVAKKVLDLDHKNTKRVYENLFFSPDNAYMIVKERLLTTLDTCDSCYEYTNQWKIVLYDIKNNFKKIKESKTFKKEELNILGFYDNNILLNNNKGILEKINFKTSFKINKFKEYYQSNNLLIGVKNGVIGLSKDKPLKVGLRKELNSDGIEDGLTMRDHVAYIENNHTFVKKFDIKEFKQSKISKKDNFNIIDTINDKYRLLLTSYDRPLFEELNLFSKKDCSKCRPEVSGKFWANWDFSGFLGVNDHLKKRFRVNFYGWYKNFIVRATRNLIFITNKENDVMAVLSGHRNEISSFVIENNILYSIDKHSIIKSWDISSINEKTRDKLIQPYLNIYLTDTDYVVWTPEGFFDASKGGGKYIGYHVNQGRFKEAEFVTLENMYETFYRPDLVKKALKGESLEEYAKNINIDKLINGGLAPEVKILTRNQITEKGAINVKVQICPKNGGFDNLSYMIDGIPISVSGTSRGLQAKTKPKQKAQRDGCFILDETLALASGENKIGFKATNKVGNIESKIDSIMVRYDDSVYKNRTKVSLGKMSKNEKVNDLHILAVAVNDYNNKDWKLNLAVNDGKEMLKTVQKVAKPLFKNVYTHELFDKKATKENILKAFKDIKSTRNDVFLLFVAGHGLTDEYNGDFYFVPVDMADLDKIKDQGIGQKDLILGLSKVTALKSLVLLDACHSGALVEADMQKTTTNKLSRATGRAILSASSREQEAKEGYEGHGIFTYTLVEALMGKGYYGDERITVNELADYTEEVLPKRALKKWNHWQTPQRSMYGTDFNLGKF